MSHQNVGRSLSTLTIGGLVLAFLYPPLLLYAIVSVGVTAGWFVSRRLGPRSTVALAPLIVGFLLAMVIGMTQQVRVNDRRDLRTVEFGWPLPWYSQDLSHLDPPFPSRVHADDVPGVQDMKLMWSDLLFDTLVLAVLQMGAFGVLALFRRNGSATESKCAE